MGKRAGGTSHRLGSIGTFSSRENDSGDHVPESQDLHAMEDFAPIGYCDSTIVRTVLLWA